MKFFKKLTACLLTAAILMTPADYAKASTAKNSNFSFPAADALEIDSTSSDSIQIFDSAYSGVDSAEPYYYTRLTELENSKNNVFYFYIPLEVQDNAVIPVEFKHAGCLIFDLEASYNDVSLDNHYSLYKEKECKNSIPLLNGIASIPKAGTYYFKFPKKYLSQIDDSIIRAQLALISSENQLLKKGITSISFLSSKSKKFYYQIQVPTASKLYFTTLLQNGGTLVLCDKNKQAITYKKEISEKENQVYAVKKGTYYLRITGASGLAACKYSSSSVSIPKNHNKATAHHLKINGSKKTFAAFPKDSEETGFYYNFRNPKKQTLYLNMNTSFTSGKGMVALYDEKNTMLCYAVMENGVTQKYCICLNDSSDYSIKPLPKGNYHLVFWKYTSKSCGTISASINTYIKH